MKASLTEGKIFPTLVRFTLPLLIGDLFQQLYNIVDTIIVGRTLGASALGAVGATGTIMFLIVGCAIALANGFGIVTSQRFGARDMQGVRQSFSNGLYLIAGISAIVSILCMIFCDSILRLMNTPEDIFADSMGYIQIIFAGLIITSFYNYFASNLRAIGNSRMPLVFLIVSSVLNVILDLFFIIVLHMGVAGASAATVLSQLVSTVMCLVYIMRSEANLKPVGSEWRIRPNLMRRQLAVGVPMALQSMITASGTMIMQAATNTFGSTAVAAVTACNKAKNIFTIVFMSTGNGIATFVGQNYGAGYLDRVRGGVKAATKFVVVYGILAGILAYTLLPFEMSLFISDATALEAMMPWAETAMLLSVFFFIPLGFIFIYRSALQACGRAVFAMSAGIVELGSRVVFAAIAIYYRNFIFAVLCDSAAWLMAGIFTCVAFSVIMHRMLKEDNGKQLEPNG